MKQAKEMTATPIAALTALLLLASLPGQHKAAPFDARVAAMMQAQKIPGLSIAIARYDKIILNRGYGLADLENQVPATEKTIYRLASISKPITAVAVMQLWERGMLDLDAPVQKYVTSFPKKRWPLTARHLLSHLGGVRHYRVGETLSNRRYHTDTGPLRIFRDDPLLFEPGTRYSYTTYGYNLLGAVAGRAAKMKFVALLQKNIFEPAGMKHAQQDDSYRLIPHRAQGYRKAKGGKLENSSPVDTSNKIPGGGLCGRAEDLARFGQALLQHRLVKHATRDLMWSRARTRSGKRLSYGLGFQLGVNKSMGKVVSHGGAQPRVRTSLTILPNRGIVIAVLCNLERSKLKPFTDAAFELVRTQSKEK